MNFYERLKERDARFSRNLRNLGENKPLLRRLSAFFSKSGDPWYCTIGCLLLLFLARNIAWQTTAFMILIGMLITGAVAALVKYSFRRKRPDSNWGKFYRKTDPHSFPSGHAARAALLPVLGFAFAPVWFGIILLVWMPLVSFGRVIMGVHYLSDVLAGWLIGGIVGGSLLWLVFF